MAKYLLVYTGGDGQPGSDEERAAIMQAWTDWFTRLGPAIVDPGNPIVPGAKSVSSSGQVSDQPVGMPATGYSVLQADSMDGAVAYARQCPHLAAGGQISVYETFNVM